MVRSDIFYLIFFGIVIMGLIFLLNTRGTSPEDPCEIHKELFASTIDSGIITSKYIDRDNHAMKTVVINVKNKNYELLFIPYNNWTDFDKIKINDVISKPANSFEFSVNNEFKFQLELDCKYN